MPSFPVLTTFGLFSLSWTTLWLPLASFFFSPYTPTRSRFTGYSEYRQAMHPRGVATQSYGANSWHKHQIEGTLNLFDQYLPAITI